MSALKDQDPDYGPSVANNEKHQRIYEENARCSTTRKIIAIIEKEFSEEISTKEKEILEVQERLHRASKTLHLLRYVIVTDFYNRKQCQQTSQTGETKQTQIHPAIKRLIGKSPKSYEGPLLASASTSFSPSPSPSPLSIIEAEASKSEKQHETDESGDDVKKRRLESEESSRPRKIPRYVPPKSGLPEPPCPSRGVRHKVRKRIIIGNISKWIPPDWREDAASHKWTMYVRGNKENPDIDDFVSKVRFFLHPSYRPNDVVEITTAPFCLSRRGWGEFPLRVQLHFKSTRDKPMDIIHHLKLDRTYTGLQTLGSETLVDIWIYADRRNSRRNTGVNEGSNELLNQELAQEEETSSNDTPVEIKIEASSSTFSSTTDPSIKLTNNLRDSLKTILHDITIKEDIEDKKSTTCSPSKNSKSSLDKLRLFVDHDHDYCDSKYTVEENNSIIRHSSSVPVSSQNGTSVEIKVEERETVPRMAINGLNSTSPTKLATPSAMKPQSNLRPLKITIPPPFESTGSKRILLLQNNKTIPVDITVPRSEESTRKPSYVSISGGTSLLKKPLEKPSRSETRAQNNSTSEPHVVLKLKPNGNVFLNVNSNEPALKIVGVNNTQNNFPPPSPPVPIFPSHLEERPKPKITLGKDKHRFQSKKDLYEQVFETIENAKIADQEGLLRFIIKRLPIVTQDACDSDYRRLHPYACTNEEEFFRWTIGKQRASEWNRAKLALYLLKKKSFPSEELWTVKEIMTWARLHAYTPVCDSFSIRPIENGIKDLSDSTASKIVFTCTEPASFHEWLGTNSDRFGDPSMEIDPCQNNETDFVDVVEVDRVDAPGKSNEATGKENLLENGEDSKITVLEIEGKLAPLQNFVSDAAREIGIKLPPEEIVPGVLHCAANRMIMRAVECFLDDIVRMSLAKAWEGHNDSGYPKVISLEDVQRALSSREEFDVFTNEGLGSKYRMSVLD